MNLTMHVKRGDKFLPDVSLSELEQTHRNEPHGKTKTMLHVAIRRKKGDILDTISKAVGIATSTIHDWLSRLEEGGLERRHDYKSPGRPCRLSEAQKKSLDKDIDQDPTKSGFSRGTWTARLVARHILNMFGIRYGDSGSTQADAQDELFSQGSQARSVQLGHSRGAGRIRAGYNPAGQGA